MMKKILDSLQKNYGSVIRRKFRQLGYDITKFKPNKLGQHPYYDMRHFVNKEKPLVFDIGANVGQSIPRIREVFKDSIIHSFEPSPVAFKSLKEFAGSKKDVSIWNIGLGSSESKLTLHDNNLTDMSSFLELGDEGWGEIKQKVDVDVTTIDNFSDKNNIDFIDIIKLDTQGFELEILNGAKKIISENKVGLILLEVTFVELYQNLPTLSSLLDFAQQNDFELVSFYPFAYRNRMALGTDALFKHKSYV